VALDPYQTRMLAELSPDARRAYDALLGMMTPAVWQAATAMDDTTFRRALRDLRRDPRTGENRLLVRRGPADHKGEWMRV